MRRLTESFSLAEPTIFNFTLIAFITMAGNPWNR